MTFYGKPRCDEHTLDHAHESPTVMLAPLYVLAFGALFAGVLLYSSFVGDTREAFWGDALYVLHENDTVHAAHNVDLWVKLLPLVMGVAGIALAFCVYLLKPALAGTLGQRFKSLHTLFYRKWYVDELYDQIFVKPSLRVGRKFFSVGDQKIINGFGPDGLAAISRKIGLKMSALQSGFVTNYALIMMISLIVLVTWILCRMLGGWV